MKYLVIFFIMAQGREVAVFGSLEDLFLQVDYYLHNDAMRDRITVAGYGRVIKEHFYYHRFKSVLDWIRKGAGNASLVG
jgi:spore maturation protein CgeB